MLLHTDSSPESGSDWVSNMCGWTSPMSLLMLAILTYTALWMVNLAWAALEKMENKTYRNQRWWAGRRPDPEFLNKTAGSSCLGQVKCHIGLVNPATQLPNRTSGKRTHTIFFSELMKEVAIPLPFSLCWELHMAVLIRHLWENGWG